MSGFSLDWLRLRAPFDEAARSRVLAQRFADAVRRRAGAERQIRLLDLGAGSGANFRFLAPIVAAAQDWVLLDDDPALLAAEPAETASWRQRTSAPEIWRSRTQRADLSRGVAGLDRYDGVAISSLLDLVSAEWAQRFAAGLAEAQLPCLAALSIDGRVEWRPAHPADERVAAAFRSDQSRDKGFGAALGAAAPAVVAEALAGAGFRIETATSDWCIEPTAGDMLAATVSGFVEAALRAMPADADAISGWADDRRRDIVARRLALRLGHRDLLALPGSARSI